MVGKRSVSGQRTSSLRRGKKKKKAEEKQERKIEKKLEKQQK